MGGTMQSLFLGCHKFNGDISGWNTENVSDMSYMFEYDNEFNSDLSSWNTDKVTDMQLMFDNAEKFSQDLCPWLEHGLLNTPKTGNMFNQTACLDESDPSEDYVCHEC